MVFIHSRLDEAGLSATTFRVYAHLARRSKDGVSWPGVPSMAKFCRLHPQTVRKALAELATLNMVIVEQRPGYTSRYLLTKPSLWKSGPASGPYETNTPPSVSHPTPPKPIEGHPYETDVDEVNPLEGNPKKGIHSLADARAERVPISSSQNSSEVQAAAIFDAYPRRAGGKTARQAIKCALRKVPFEQLLRKTEGFAKVWADALPGEKRYCPHPAKWFTEERYDDDPATWRPAPAAKGPSAAGLRNLDQRTVHKFRTERIIP